MTTRTITGTIYHPGGNTPWALGKVKLTLMAFFGTSVTTYPGDAYEATTDAAGLFSLTVAVPTTGSAAYRVALPSGESFSVNLQAGGAITLEELVAIAADPAADQNTLQTLIDVHEAVKASTTLASHVELATVPEAQAGTDAERAVTPAGLSAFLDGISDLYYLKIKRIFGSSIVAYWPLWEPSGSVAYDISGNGRNGVYTGVDLGYPGIGDGRTCPYFDGSNDYINVYSASLANAFNGAEGTILIWSKVYDAAVWTDGLQHFIAQFPADSNNRFQIHKSANNSLYWVYKAGGITKIVILATTPTTFVHLGLTWSKSNNRMRAFYAGSQTGVNQTGFGTWAGSLSSDLTLLGAASLIPNTPFYGYLDHGVLLNREATPAEMAKAATL